MNYTIAITHRLISGYAELCPWLGDDDHTADDCDAQCRWLDGDVRQIGNTMSNLLEFDLGDLQEYGNAVEWAVTMLRRMESFEPSRWPIGETARPHEWLCATTPNNYDETERETTVRLIGSEWTEHERATVFRRVTAA